VRANDEHKTFGSGFRQPALATGRQIAGDHERVVVRLVEQIGRINVNRISADRRLLDPNNFNIVFVVSEPLSEAEGDHVIPAVIAVPERTVRKLNREIDVILQSIYLMFSSSGTKSATMCATTLASPRASKS
jgi:hypothetical protein